MKKRRTKLLSLMLAASMVLTGVMPAMAAGNSETVNQAADGGGQPMAVSGTDAQMDCPGLAAEYYTIKGGTKDAEFDQLKSSSIDYYIQYGDMDGKLQEQTGQADKAGVRWTGRLKVPETATYTFSSKSDNGFRLWIEGQQLINYWDGDSWDKEQTSEGIRLESGKYYTFQADFFDWVGGSNVTLYWKNDGKITQAAVVPGSAFFLPESFKGLYISGLDTTKANLKEGDDPVGTVDVQGTGFTSATEFEVVKSNGASLENPVKIAAGAGISSTKASLTIPKLKAGTYKIKAVEGSSNVLSKNMLVVLPASTEGQTRAERPRADWEREDFVNLNGWWDFAFDPGMEGDSKGWFEKDAVLEQKINVPFCWESSLSGVEEPNYLGQAWYQKKVTPSQSWQGKKIFLKFGAVDWKCKLWVNGEEVGEHTGGYNAFEFDVTDYMTVGQENTVTLWVEDKGSYGNDSYPALIGKQGRNAPCGYIHTSGIWQTVGMEARSASYLDNARAAVDVDKSTVTYKMDITSDKNQELTVEYDFTSKLYNMDTDKDELTGSNIKGSQKVSVNSGKNSVDLAPVTVQEPKLWNYNEPNLYYGTITVKDAQGSELDKVNTYFGMRKVEQKYFDESLGVKYIYINGAPVYMSGLLDQGFWEDGIYTAPSEEALKYDVLKMKEAGFNMIRKHLKVEDPLQYYWCDKLGMMVWQDMPHATAMVPDNTGDQVPGRQYYEECLESMMNMNYNHPSIVAVMLFNETWGLQKAYFESEGQKRDVVAADGKSTGQWVEELFYKTKELNPNLLVEDMSPCNFDHVQPTELNTYHMYPGGYDDTLKNYVERQVNGAYPDSTEGFKFGEKQDGDPLLNSEYGGVGAYDGDYDVSYCFKYMTDIQRRYEKQSGFVYTEPYDVEYERNGIMTYDRNMKVFGYDEIAYGGDMSIRDLTQEIYVGIVDQPMRKITPGTKMKTKTMAIGWTNDLPEKVVMKWRFDGTDIYGNQISTGISGEKKLNMSPYRKVSSTIEYTAPAQACVGTLTIWLEDEEGQKLAKNFTNVIVEDGTLANEDDTQQNEDGSVSLKAKVDDAKMASSEGTKEQTYSYTLPGETQLKDIKSMRILAEASSYKKQLGTDKNLSTYSSEWGQTAEGRERPSDLTVSVNGVEVDTVYLPDDPRDMRGTLTLNQNTGNLNKATSAGDFGYLINLNITGEKLEEIKNATENGAVTVTYQVKEDAEHKNGFRIYTAKYGRYAVNPTLILNPADQAVPGTANEDKDIEVKGNNYSVEAVLEKGEGYIVRNDGQGGYSVKVTADGTKVALAKKSGDVIAEAAISGSEEAHNVKVTLFDEQIRIYVDNDPEPIINVYDKSGFTGGVTLLAGAENAAVAPESYKTVKEDVKKEQPKVDYKDDFSADTLDSRYEKMGNDLRAEVSNGELKMSAGAGDKLIIKDLKMADGVYEADFTIGELTDGGGNVGFTFRSSNYKVGADGLDGYYAGLGDGYVILGRMNNNWTELKREKDSSLKPGTKHRLKVAVFGSRIQVYVDDVEAPYIDVVDTTYTEGGAAIRGFRCSAAVSDLRIANTLNYTSDFNHGVEEWTENGTWSDDGGIYKTDGEKAFAYIDGSRQSDIVVAADVKAEAEEALPAVMFRASESAGGLNGYRVALNVKENKIQLIKSVDGQDSVLAERGWKLEAGKTYRVVAEAQGSHLKVYLDGSNQALLSVKDTSFDAGAPGLYSEQGSSIFDNFAVNAKYIDGETLAPVNTDGLDTAIAFAKSLKKENYTAESCQKLEKALKAAEEADRYEQESVNRAAAELQEVLLGLVEENAGGNTAELEEALKKALAAQKAAEENAKKTNQALEEAKKAADAARKTVQELQKELDKLVKKGYVFQSGNLKYKVTDVKKRTVSVTGSADKKGTSINIKATVKYAGKNYKITAVAKNAFKNNKKLTKAVIGSNVIIIEDNAFYGNTKLKNVTIGKKVQKIGTSAFYKNSSLKKITVKSSGLKSVGKNAFKKIPAKAVIDVPNNKVKAYKKLLKKAGQAKSVVIK